MKHSQRDTVHRVRAVRSWLEKAEASFDKESDIKGELNLMLAEAEMKNLRKHHPVSKGWLRTGAVITALFLALGGWYGFHLYGQGASPPVMGTVTPAPAAGKEAGQARQLRPRLQQSLSRPRRYRLLPRPYRHRQRSQQPLPPRIGRTYGTARRDGCHRTSDASAVSAGSGADRNEGSLIGPPGTSYGTRSTSYFARYEYDKIDNGGFL